MSKQLSKIRNLISEIDEIQKKGQSVPHFVLLDQVQETSAASILAAQSEVGSNGLIETKKEDLAVEQEKGSNATLTQSVDLEKARVAIKFTGNVVVQLEIDDANDSVEVSRTAEGMKILFSDGKAVHLPLKFVA